MIPQIRHLVILNPKSNPRVSTRGLSYEFSATGVTAATGATAANIAIATAAPDDNQKNDNPTAVIATKTGIAHIGTSYELLTAEAATPHTMHNIKSGS